MAFDAAPIATSFVRGVNAYIALVRDRPPVEFTLLGYKPEPWTPDVPLQRMAALSMTGNAELEVVRAQLVELGCARPLLGQLATLAHELHHAAEIAAAPAVVDNASLIAHYERIGSRSESDSGSGRFRPIVSWRR